MTLNPERWIGPTRRRNAIVRHISRDQSPMSNLGNYLVDTLIQRELNVPRGGKIMEMNNQAQSRTLHDLL